jgi:hypothetical protein
MFCVQSKRAAVDVRAVSARVPVEEPLVRAHVGDARAEEAVAVRALREDFWAQEQYAQAHEAGTQGRGGRSNAPCHARSAVIVRSEPCQCASAMYVWNWSICRTGDIYFGRELSILRVGSARGVANREAPLIDGRELASSRLVSLCGMLVEGVFAVGVDSGLDRDACLPRMTRSSAPDE